MTLNKLPYNFFLLVINPFFDIKLPQFNNFYTISSPSKQVKNSGQLLSQPKNIQFIKSVCQKNSFPAVIIPFKPSPKIEIICQKNNWILASNKRKLNLLFEDKISFHQLCRHHHLPSIPSVVDILDQDTFRKYSKKFGQKLVIQTRHGWTGNSTFIFDSYHQTKNIISQGTLVKFSPFLSGYTLTTNSVLVKNHLVSSPPALQYNGFPPFSDNPFSTIGRQWPSLASKRIQNKVKKIITKFSLILKKNHYQGFFGLDFLVSKNKVYLVECNPRLTASYNFYTKIEQKNKLTPLFYYHLLSFLPLSIKKPTPRFYNTNISGSQLTYKNRSGDTVKIIHSYNSFVTSLDPNTQRQQLLSIHEKTH